jgi:branched-chain amino acid transport system substrate-binding protein
MRDTEGEQKMPTRRAVNRAVAAALVAAPLAGGPAFAQDGEPIVIGEINSYTRLPAFLEPYKRGWELGLEQINEAGGIDGRPLEIISRDDTGDPGTAVRIADELVNREDVAFIFGTFLSNIGLAVSDFAKQNEVFFLASEPLTDALVWSDGNDYTFRLRPSTHMQAAMLAKEAAATDATRWATIAPNYAYGRDAVEAFKRELTKLKPEVEFVEEQWPTLFRIDAGAAVRALERSRPEGIYNVTFGGDLAKFVREGQLRFLFEDRVVVSLLSGEPEYLEPLGNETPDGWIVTGYPGFDVDTPEHDAFEEAYFEKWGMEPKTGSIVGYNSMMTIKTLLEQSPSLETEDLLATMEGLEVESPTGPFVYRPADHQATMGAYVGKTALVDGEPSMVDWYYAPGEDYLPPEEEALQMRPEDAR